MTRIIGHRGAAGLALENTTESFLKALELGVDHLEFDVHATRDGKIVVCHGETLALVSNSSIRIKDATYAELQKIPLHNGEHILLLRDALHVTDTIPILVEIKVSGHTETICNILDDFIARDITITTFLYDVVTECRRLRPQLPVFVGERRHPLRIISIAKRLDATGLVLYYKILNPITYWLANRAGWQIMAYTTDSRVVAWWLRGLYPRVWICTNHPERLIKRAADSV